MLFSIFFIHQIAVNIPQNLTSATIDRGIYAMTQAVAVPRTFLIGVVAITAVWSLHFLDTTGRAWWTAGFAFTASYIAFFSWQIFWALATLNGKGWGTRGNKTAAPALQTKAPGSAP